MKRFIKICIVLVCVFLISVLAGFSYGYIRDRIGNTRDITHTEHVPSIHIEGLAERLKNNETRLYYMAVAEIQDGRAKLAREDGQSWWINNFGFYQFEHVLVEMDEHNTYAYEDDTVKNVWRFE